MKNKKGNVAVIAIIIVIVAITASLITWLVATKTQTPVQQLVAAQPAPVAKTQSPKTTDTKQSLSETKSISNEDIKWKNFLSTSLKATISLPADWLMVLPYDGSLREIPNNIFENMGASNDFITFSSPDKSYKITFESGPIFLENNNCSANGKYSNGNMMSGKRVNVFICPDATEVSSPGRYNYNFIDWNLTISSDKESPLVDKIISNVEFKLSK
jgi:hypothetical protein